ncbi:MAG: ATP-binding protein [Rhodothermales bacterium]
MNLPFAYTTAPVPVDELRRVPGLEGLEDRLFDWLAEHGEYLEIPVGEKMFSAGMPAEQMMIQLDGAVQLVLDVGGQPLLYNTFRGGQITGMLPYSRMTEYTGTGLVIEPARVVMVWKKDFPAMLERSEELGRRLVALMSDRVREATRSEQQSEKLAALGKLSAGLAHELNNPAAAIRRSVSDMQERVATLPELVARMSEHRLSPEQIRLASAVQRELAEEGPKPDQLSVVARGELEDDLANRLDALGVEDGWRLAETLADAGLTPACLDEIAADVDAAAVPDVLRWVEGGLAADRLLAEIGSAAGRISELVASVKTYSHMDQAPVKQPTDVVAGIESTLTMLGHKFRSKNVRLVRTVAEGLPLVPAYPGELNQVWTNLLDNALDAVAEGGTIEVAAEVSGRYLCVSVIDDGTGIPEEIQSRVFEPFFTTKGVGDGSGLGLDMVQRIVRNQHSGTLDLESRPGRTEFVVCLPLAEEA